MDTIEKLRAYWEKEYTRVDTPFDVEQPDEWIAALEKSGKILGHVLDSGCGPGRTAIYLSRHGYRVTGVDISGHAIERAQEKAAQAGCDAHFICSDMCGLSGYDGEFDTVIDIGCLHSLFDEGSRQDYAASLHRVCREGAVVYLRAISDTNMKRKNVSGKCGIPALSENDVRKAFEPGWEVRQLEEREIDLLTDHGYRKAHCWFAEMVRLASQGS